ncbi:MAG: NHL repeat-containing protein, partial [Nitrospinaceae bacterium]
SNDRIRVVDRNGIIRTYAGNGRDGYNGDNKPALSASLDKPFGLAMDGAGNLYIADRGNNRIRKVDKSGIITTAAGDGGFYFIGDNGPAYRASIAGPTDVALDAAGNLYIADRNNNRIRLVDPQGMIRTVVGTGQQDYNGDSEVARETNLNKPFAIALDPEGNLLIVDRSHYRIRRVDPNGSKVENIAGNGVKLFGGDGGPAPGARLNFPHGIVVDSHDNVIVADKSNFRLRKITPQGIITTYAGTGVRGNIGDGLPMLEASMFPTSMGINSQDEIFFVSPSGYVSLIRKIGADGIIRLFLSSSGTDYQDEVLKSKYVGRAALDQRAAITHFSDVLPDKKGNLYVADRLNNQIRLVDGKGQTLLVAGTGSADYTGDGGLALEATFRDPRCLALDDQGQLYVGDGANSVIRKIDSKGIISTIAGTGEFVDNGDGGPALKAGLRSIDAMEFSPAGELYFVETGSHVVRKIKKDGTIVTVAGRAGIQGYFGDNGPAPRAMLKQPTDLAFDSKGNLYISDMGNNRIRKVDTHGVITTLAGSGAFGWGAEGENVEIYFQNFP